MKHCYAMATDTLDLCSQSRQVSPCRAKSCQPLPDRVFTQPMGEVEEEDALISLALRRVHRNVEQTSDNRLLWRAKVEKTVRAGTLARLVRQLAPLGEEEEADAVSAYRTCFLATYRTFASAGDVLGHLTDW